MKGKWTKLYEKYFREVIEALKSSLLEKLKNRKYETPEEITAQHNIQISHSINGLYKRKTTDGRSCISWFKERLFKKFSTNSNSFDKNFYVDAFLESILPEIRSDFTYHYDRADQSAKLTCYYDADYALSATNEEVIRLIATRNAYDQFVTKRHEYKEELLYVIQKEKLLVDQNNFNSLPPIEVFKFFKQLTQINPVNNQPFLTEKQVYDLTNMICRNELVTNTITINIFNRQSSRITWFVYVFYRYCIDTVDENGSQKKYISILTRYTSQ